MKPTIDIEILKSRLAQLQKTQLAMAKELGINNSRISDLKKGRLKEWKYRAKISKYLGVAQEILFPEDGN